MRTGDRTLRFLLSRGHLTGADHDRIVDRVMARRSARFRSWRLAVGTLTLAATATVAIAVALHRPQPQGASPWLAAKGKAGAILQAHCVSRPEGTCRRGDRLLFATDGISDGGFLAAYADGPLGDRIWYFPAADGHLAEMPAHEGSGLAREVADIAEDHPFGRYTLHLLLLVRRADRATILEGKAQVRATTVTALNVAP